MFYIYKNYHLNKNQNFFCIFNQLVLNLCQPLVSLPGMHLSYFQQQQNFFYISQVLSVHCYVFTVHIKGIRFTIPPHKSSALVLRTTNYKQNLSGQLYSRQKFLITLFYEDCLSYIGYSPFQKLPYPFLTSPAPFCPVPSID